MKRLLLFAVMASVSLLSAAQDVQFDKIRHWAGQGEKRAALVVQFNDGKKDVAYVWGYRWNGSASGEDMIRAIVNSSHSLSVLVQYTGSMGSTLDGVGVSRERCIQDGVLRFDFSSACDDYRISYDYFDPNTIMGQESAPGDAALEMCNNAIRHAYDNNTGIIEHPLNARRYGYPAYDYDYWQLTEDSDEYHWQAGWYEGYWSYWVGQQGEELVYSGLGMSSAQLADGSVNLWNYVSDMTEMGTAPDPTENLDYELAAFDEYMSEPTPVIYPVDFDRIRHWAGNEEGEKFAAVVVKFNDGKGPDTIVTGYKWTGGWDDNVATVLDAVFKTDSRFHVEMDGTNIKSVTYDSDGNGIIDDSDHNDTSGTWQTFADYTNESEVFEVVARRFINPRAVLILTRTAEGEDPDYDISSFTYRPAIDETAISIPEKTYADSNASEISIPFFAQNVNLNGHLSCLADGMTSVNINRVSNNNIHMDISGLTPGDHKIVISAESATRAEIVSNECLLTVKGTAGIEGIRDHIDAGSLLCSPDGRLTAIGYAGYRFDIIDLAGRTIDSFTADSDIFRYQTNVPCGIYLVRGVSGNDVITSKFISK